VLAGGYRERRWWVSATGDDEGWRWASYRNATHPSFWVATRHPDMAAYVGGSPGYPYQKDDASAAAGDGPDFKLRTLFAIIDMPWDWPAEVNFHEAHAFLRWKAAGEGGAVTYRVPTEAEYHLIRGDGVPGAGATSGARLPPGAPAGPVASTAAALALPGADAGRVLLPDGSVATGAAGAAAEAGLRAAHAEASVDVMMQGAAPGNLNLRWGSSTPVNMYPPSSTGFYDAHGNVWQYAEDHFAPLPGFEIHYMYDDFSSPCFDGWHTLILGGSWVSTGDQASSFARYHFRRHFFQHLGFRYVAVPTAAPEPYPGAATVTNLWEGMSTVSNDLTNGYAPAADRVPFPRALVDTDNALAYAANLASAAAAAYASHAAGCGPAKEAARVLLLGCGVGEVAFALAAAGFGAVVGVDAAEAAVRHSRIMQHHAQLEYERVTEGVLTTTALVRTPAGVDRSRVTFFNSPLAALTPDAAAGGPFDLVLVNDALCRAVQPLDIVTSLPGIVRPGGVAVVACSNDWDAAVTPRNSWLGGFKLNGEDMTTLHMLQHYLKRAFAFKEAVDVPRLTRAHGRKFTLEVLEVSVFQRAA